MKKGKVGDWCRNGAVPEERFLFYPDGSLKHVKDVYTIFPICDEGLSCFREKCKWLKFKLANKPLLLATQTVPGDTVIRDLVLFVC